MSTLIKNNNKWLKIAGSGVPPVDVVEEDNMNPVTSNAVAEALEDLENDVADLKTDVTALKTNVSQDLSTLNWNTQYVDLGSWSTGGIIKKAGVVQFNKIFTVKAGISASGALICSGLPRPAMQVEVPMSWDGDSAIGGFFLTANGDLYSFATVTADTNCRINLCYIAAED